MRALLPALLLLASCGHLSPAVSPETLEGFRPVAETWCSENLSSRSSPVWFCKIYEIGERTFVAFHHALTGDLLAIGERIGDSPRVVIRWALEVTEEMASGVEL